MIKNFFVSCFFLFYVFLAQAAKVDTLKVFSRSMHLSVEVITITPEAKGAYPVLYLLHGYAGDATSWLAKKTNLPEIADRYGLIIVCPDGKDNWYWDSPIDASSQYETFMTKELISYIDGHFPTLAKREARVITGLSMGGHGAMFLAMRHTDLFSAAGSMSGGLDIRPFPKNWKMKLFLGSQKNFPKRWEAYTAINQMDGLKPGLLDLVIDCGQDDFFLGVNKAFHCKLWKLGIPHDFSIRPGGHTWDFWRNAIDYQLVFFMKHFRKMNLSKMSKRERD